MTTHRNCASGMEAITTGAERLLSGRADVIAAVATESMSHIPLLYNPLPASGWRSWLLPVVVGKN